MWISSPSNIGKTKLSTRQAGIPSVQQTWKEKIGRYGLMSDICLTDSEIYALSAGDVLCVDLSKGSVLWEDLFEDKGHNGRGICLNGEYLCAGLYILKRKTGRVCLDFREVLKSDAIGNHSFVVPYKEGFIRNFEHPSAGCYFLDRCGKPVFFKIVGTFSSRHLQFVFINLLLPIRI